MEAEFVYRFHIVLRGVNPKIWRRVELTAGSSLADLQRVIQISLGWSVEYQHRFCIRNHYLGASRSGGLLFFGDPEAMTLSQSRSGYMSASPMSTISSTIGSLMLPSVPILSIVTA